MTEAAPSEKPMAGRSTNQRAILPADQADVITAGGASGPTSNMIGLALASAEHGSAADESDFQLIYFECREQVRELVADDRREDRRG